MAVNLHRRCPRSAIRDGIAAGFHVSDEFVLRNPEWEIQSRH